jgi:hypothetical protein
MSSLPQRFVRIGRLAASNLRRPPGDGSGCDHPRMRPYARTPWRAARQLAADLIAVGLVVLAVLVARRLHDTILLLGEPGRRLASTGADLGTNLRQAADRVGDLPLVGNDVRGPLDRAGVAAGALVRAGQQQQAVVDRVATMVAVLVVAFVLLLLLFTWLPVRVRFARRAGAAQRFVDSNADLDLFALRAMAGQPLHVLARISDDPAGAWRRRDPVVVRRLAELELRSVGMRPPRLR